ncbi:MAG: hypothetical protein QOG15_3195 [Solirubrobacteraceae bacterium]|nr:hypothetical protein [Solirubrobacteraceae bacterium]
MSALRRLRVVAACAAAGATLGLAPAAFAQGPAPQVDPQSPAGAEYQLPLDRARAASASHTSAAAVAEPLFGEGVTADTRGSGERASGTPATDDRARDASHDGRGVVVRARPPAVSASIPGGAGGSLLAIAAAAAAVLAAGGLAGLAWRRRSVGR